jgi:hypothetical protein
MMNSFKWIWRKGAWIFIFFNMVGFWVWIRGQWVSIYFFSNWWVFGCGWGLRFFFLAFQKNGTLGLDWGMEGKGFHGSFMFVKVLELEYKSHLGFISFFNQTMTFV